MVIWAFGLTAGVVKAMKIITMAKVGIIRRRTLVFANQGWKMTMPTPPTNVAMSSTKVNHLSGNPWEETMAMMNGNGRKRRTVFARYTLLCSRLTLLHYCPECPYRRDYEYHGQAHVMKSHIYTIDAWSSSD